MRKFFNTCRQSVLADFGTGGVSIPGKGYVELDDNDVRDSKLRLLKNIKEITTVAVFHKEEKEDLSVENDDSFDPITKDDIPVEGEKIVNEYDILTKVVQFGEVVGDTEEDEDAKDSVVVEKPVRKKRRKSKNKQKSSGDTLPRALEVNDND